MSPTMMGKLLESDVSRDDGVAVCGDGLLVGNEVCDDNNTESMDGCSASCSVETGYNCSRSSSTVAFRYVVFRIYF